MPTPNQWSKIKEIVGAALEREPADRAEFLDQACARDQALRDEVDSLLVAYASSAPLSANPWANTTVAESATQSKVIGPYRLIHTLGVGGMGQVWLAEQTEPVRRRVALKLIRAGIYDRVLIQRFQSERQSLAIMEHPAIAKVFDAGTTAEGQPYFAMEYVDGPPITDYCDRKKLGIRDRLKLFMQVCDGVQHAHQKAIIHRDLKPSNILVAEVDGKPTPRIIDFGLAKAVALVPAENLFTHVGSLLGTPGYMSPEQADPNVVDIDTRTDVYSLGVVLYELLTGSLPFHPAQWKTKRLDEVLRQLRDAEPERPSMKVGANPNSSAVSADARGTGQQQLFSTLRGDLDSITLKALEKERERRYGTPSALAADVERYLEDRPVEARPESVGYRLQKYIRRHRIAVAVATGAALLLVAFAIAQTIQLRRITRERDRADRITDFMTNMFKVSDPSEARGNTITAREILDKSAKEIDAGLAKDPALKAQMLSVMATVYRGLGLDSRAQPLLDQAIALSRSELGPEHPDTLRLRGQLGPVLTSQGRYQEAERLEQTLLDEELRVLGPEHRITLATRRDLFSLLGAQGHPVEAETIGRETVDLERRIFGNEDPETLLTMRELAAVMERADHLPAAEALTRQIIGIRQRRSGNDDPRTLMSLSDLGRILNQEERAADAEAVYRPALAMQQRVLGPDHPSVVSTMDGLAMALRRQHKLDEAENLCRGALDIASRRLGPEHPTTLMEIGNLALMLQERGRYQGAERLQRQVLEVSRRTLGPDHYNTSMAMNHVAELLHLEGRNDESAALFRETADIQRRTLGTGHRYTLNTLYNLACVLASQHKSDEALSILRGVVDKGFASADDLKTDPDFRSLQSDARFEGLIKQGKQSNTHKTKN